MILVLIVIILIITFFSAFVNFQLSRKISIQEESVERLKQEKLIVVNFMHSISGAIIGEKNRKKLFQKIVHASITNTGATCACLFEKKDNGRLERVAVEGLFPPQNFESINRLKNSKSRTELFKNTYKNESYALGEGLIGSVGKSIKPILIEQAKNDPRVLQHDDPSLHIHSLMLSPVTHDGALIAILAVANPIDGTPFNDMDFSLLQSLASQVGLAIQNSTTIQLQIEKNKIDLDLQLAQNIQSLLLPKTFPLNTPLEFAAYYAPAQKIGGDLYDIFEIDSDLLGVTVADVSGKGIPASIVMAKCQTHLKHLIKNDKSPAEILKLVNTELCKTMQPGMFVTLILGIINLKKHTITIARAGHEAPLFYESNKSEEVKPINIKGMALGIVPKEIFDPKIADLTLPFNEGDILILYTDGLTETENNRNEEFGSNRLKDIIQQNKFNNAKVIMKSVMSNIKSFADGQKPQDDQTILIIKHLKKQR